MLKKYRINFDGYIEIKTNGIKRARKVQHELVVSILNKSIHPDNYKLSLFFIQKNKPIQIKGR